jgi:hypothetical protein
MQDNDFALLTQQQVFLVSDDKIDALDITETKNYFTALTIPLNLLETLSFKLSKSLTSEDLQIQVEMKMYREGGLNVDDDYAIDFIKYDVGDEYLIEAFALSRSSFHTYTHEYIHNLVAVDYTLVRFLMYQSLYLHGYEKGHNDLIIYLHEDEAFGAIYQDGKYIGHRVLNSLSSISKRTGVELVKLKEFLEKKGFIKENYAYDEMHIIDAIEEVFLKDIEKLVYSINHKRSMFGLDGIDNIYIDFYNQNLLGIEAFFKPFGYETLIPQVITLPHTQKVDDSLYLEATYIDDSLEPENDLVMLNLSLLERKEPLFKYISIKYAGIVGITLACCFAFYGYLYYQETLLDNVVIQKEKKLKDIKKKSKKLLLHYKKLKSKNKKLLEVKTSLEKEVQVYETTLDILPMMEAQKRLRQRFMNDVVSSLAKYKLNTQYMHQINTKSMELMLVSQFNNRDTIAKFMNELVKKKYAHVYTKLIQEEDGIYKSKVWVER